MSNTMRVNLVAEIMYLGDNGMRWLNTQNYWGGVTITIHWLTAITVCGLFGFGLWMVELEYYDSWYRKGPDLHKSIGISLLVLTLVRLVWHRISHRPAPLSSHIPRELKMAMATHYLIYLLLVTVMFSGYLISTADGRAIAVFDWFHIPAVLHGIDKQEDIAGTVHLWLAVSLISLATVHAIAAIKHHYFDQDRTLKRMFGL